MNSSKPEIIGYHLDLKYLMPKKKDLMEWLERLPGFGINTLLVEYEDKFPFRKYPFLRDPDAFTEAELTAFLNKARKQGLTVIPLVQCLAHLEFALSHEELSHLREMPDIFFQICPSKPDAVEFVFDLYREVLEYHKDDPYFHCGADEATMLGKCDRCRTRMEKEDKVDMWLDHTGKVIDWVMKAGKRPIVWDDIFWHDPHRIETSGLPKELILHAWNYAIMDLDENDVRTENNEFGYKAGGSLPQIEIYHANGYETIAAPCMNYGQVFPRHGESINNTRAWATKIHRSGMKGMINTSWACFHTPPATQNLYVAMTGDLCQNPASDVGDNYVKQWFHREYGSVADGIAGELEPLGKLWEIRIPGLKRPFSPMVWCYMNMVLYYENFEDRCKRGPYPQDWSVINFSELYQRGVELVKKGEMKPIYERLDDVLEHYAKAVSAFDLLAKTAEKQKKEAGCLATYAKLKWISAKVFAHLVRGDGDRAELVKEIDTFRPDLENALALTYEPTSQQRLVRAWWDSHRTALKSCQTGPTGPLARESDVDEYDSIKKSAARNE